MLNNDMIGNSLSSGTNLRDNTKVRVFAQLPRNRGRSKMRKLTNRDNDSPSRLLARYIKNSY
jgi:tRNA nucleotidyltransferase (CCA-adding enzyme)